MRRAVRTIPPPAIKESKVMYFYEYTASIGLAVYHNLIDDFCNTSSRLFLLNSMFNSQETNVKLIRPYSLLCVFSLPVYNFGGDVSFRREID